MEKHKLQFLLKSRIQLLLIAGYLAAAAAIVYVGAISYNRYKKDLIAAEQKELLMIAETIGKSLVNYIEQELNGLDLYCRMMESDSRKADRKYLEEHTRIYLEKKGDLYTAAASVDDEGQITKLYGRMNLSADGLDGSISRGGADSLGNSGNKFFLESRESENGADGQESAFICGKSITGDGGYQLYLARKFCGGDNCCYLVYAMDLNEIYQKIVAPVRIGEGGYSVVKDSSLSIIMHHASNQIGMDAVFDRGEKYPQLDLRDLTAWVEYQRRQPEGVGMIHSYVWDDPDLAPEDRVVAYTTIELPGETWIVNSTIPYNEIEGPLRLMLQRLIGICLVFIGFLSLFIIIITRNLVWAQSQKKEINYLREINAGMELLRHKEEEIQHYQRVQTIGQMSSQIAHEFNNYLTPVMVYAELLEGDASLGEENQKLIQGILKSTNQAANLSRKLLDFSRQETSVLLTAICITEDVKAAMQMIRQLAPQKISVEEEITSQNFYIQGRKGMIGHILMNLCNNAFHAMEKEGGRLTVYLALADGQDFAAGVPVRGSNDFSGENWIILSVKDSGCGMDEEVLEKIFEPFYTTKGKGKGTGLGLSVIHNIVSATGGRIRVATKPGEGSCFSLFFPELPEEKRKESREHRENKEKLDGEKEKPDGEKEKSDGEKDGGSTGAKTKPNSSRMVIVDDDPEMLQSLGAMAKALGYPCEIFQHPAAVIAKIQKHPDSCDLILTDYSMPCMNGVELCEIVRKLNPQIRLILMSGTEDVRFSWYLKNAFIDEFILKSELAKRFFK